MVEGLFAVARIAPQGFSAPAAPAAAPSAITGPSFAEVLGGRIESTVGSLVGAENMAIQAVRGEVDTREVADAVMSAEQSLQAAIAIRDKLVQAYLEVSRMQI